MARARALAPARTLALDLALDRARLLLGSVPSHCLMLSCLHARALSC